MQLTTMDELLTRLALRYMYSSRKLQPFNKQKIAIMYPKYLLLAYLYFLLQLCTAQSSAALTIEPYTFKNRAGTEVEAELGSFQVPENRHTPEGKMLTLKFVRFKSTNPNPGVPIVYLAGGPGGSGISAASGSRFDLFMSMRSVADVIAFDQRGTGMSDGPPNYMVPINFPQDQPLTKELATPIIREAVKTANQYFKEQGTDLRGYTTNESADDLNTLRIALGAEKISLWGISYGSHLALTALKRHDEYIDRAIIAGVEGYDHTVKMPIDQQQLLVQIDHLLKDDPRTARAYPEFLGELEKLKEQLSKQPITVNANHPFLDQKVPVTVGKLDAQILIAGALRGPDNFKDLPFLVHQLLAGNHEVLAPYAFYTKVDRIRGMSLAMDIASGISPERRKLLEQQAKETILGDAINGHYFAGYDALKEELDAGPTFRAPFATDVPVLCISGTLDGRTPPGNAVETLQHLKNGYHLIIKGAGHSDPLFLSSPRIEEIMIDFMQGKPIEDEVIDLPPVEFTLPE
ncbi:MAG: alpha/beta hydrolase [Bacteroidota bacterium]